MKLKALKILDKLVKSSEELWELSNAEYPGEFTFFLDYEDTLKFVYLLYRKESKKETYNKFSTPGIPDDEKPIAWYRGEFNSKSDGSILGPKSPLNKDIRFSGFIPDCINDVILTPELSVNQKHKLLTKMFKDLKMLEKRHTKR